ncbi:hypothetical protein A3D05_01870 [Candidatus Gottesmanbacteria bacterium RIFCSPHIGHO2_02_FULL_40_24]|uniref:FAD/NAD(P)-binding domain-containing protein n=1 Tax=Candidatus Gottesmanbacteria bacterium RIFCSPHIGHO2_01_FULL_40_15 TaxID=1798376 RepID=A0A1F5Z089_9BACT|nr:MAG: hypothetical protein A2777_00275 [Candidatus Gottesmanbacteria bacterium RIFCSPHIGHO2_01_FULL_40_15]OGG18604.1 MAG: hypothetical protein A3D05_01870 [Candidatus Gottesmanbacteria bacterium RIFCSPHIGHO2_02_FULL_40_24]OGG22847.1 MAG: hypothetical protein A3B48_05680 [Candidatus Gottesmanbacteria bacterium RIFCSPLOWO2_01_FULL_40_10]OGG24918.1 MAG: hypothetical protein A3E42_02690 [Candidatus Gottesmanbacteria bacterium RIFCSPHIGHO2_12_FULL_40_13]OGG31739.1 MAG: hypothetical protein A3I80_0
MDISEILDLIIIGSGPAGLTSSIYASCFHLKHTVIGEHLGGQLQYAPHILNYPGFPDISGRELTERMVEQVNKREGKIITDRVNKISNYQIIIDNIQLKGYLAETQTGNKYFGRAIILATGTERRKLNIPGEVEYTAKGVHYCATCEQFDYEGKTCVIVGGANSAVQAAVELAQAAGKVYIMYRGDQLRGDPIWIEQIERIKKIEVFYKTEVLEILGDGNSVNGVKFKIRDDSSRGIKILNTDKVFIEIGGIPGTSLVIPLGVTMDKGGYIIVDDTLATNISGIFAAGDLVSYGLSIEQISSAVGLGARAAASAFAYLKQKKAPILWGQSHIKR